MSDQRMNASDQGTQPDSGSNPNDQTTVSAQATGGTGVPESHGSMPEDQAGNPEQAAEKNVSQGYDGHGRDNINQIKG
jgi:hypothetical protein